MNNCRQFLWWEKTVEYAYLAKTLRDASFAISPLDGNIETNMGDAIAASGLSYGIVEFKRDIASIATETDKYGDGNEPDYRKWRERVMDPSTRRFIPEGYEPHSLVYGYLGKTRGRPSIGTVTTRYWWPNLRLRRPKLCKSEVFALYLGRLALFRNTKSISGSTGGTIFGFDGSGSPMVHIDLESALRTYRSDYDYANDPVAGPIPAMG
ncbi:hypothetical protein [Rhizobium sp. Root651]|uniref:hypothetical protein n=1 Tax=Rhizobium sp. Root651 TaxID=1736577 RepID=UPI000715A644|nr:hypothetical protein [Rhizobium sp. Root651]KRA61140.1 hypothetical protein ASD85_27420 [Rhizobium sp. Root651]